MLEVLLTVVPSLCWLFLRCYRLLHTPAAKLVRQLNVEIPDTPVVCVDSLGRNHVLFHWGDNRVPGEKGEKGEKGAKDEDENIFYAVMVNGKDVGTLSHTSVKLSNLAPDSLYSIQVLAVNVATNFISQSAAVYVHTPGGKNSSGKFDIGTKIELANHPTPAQIVPASSYAAAAAAAASLTADDVMAINSEPVLIKHLCALQNELAKTTADHDTLSKAQLNEERRLADEIDAYKKELSEGTDFRAKKDSDLKDLERQKDSLSFRKLKLSRQLKNLQNQRIISTNKLADLRSRVSKLAEKRLHTLNVAESEKLRADENTSARSRETDSIKAAIARAEDALKEVSAEKKALLALVASLGPLVNTLPADSSNPASSTDDINAAAASPPTTVEVFTRDGHFTKYGAHMVQRISALNPEWEPELKRELDIVKGLDKSWRDSFRQAIASYVMLHNSVENARFANDNSYEPQRLTEYQASIHFGGYSNALPKPAAKKKPILVFNEGVSSSSPSPPPPSIPANSLSAPSHDRLSRSFYNTSEANIIEPSVPESNANTASREPNSMSREPNSMSREPNSMPRELNNMSRSPNFMSDGAVRTPQSLNASMVALQQLSNNGKRVNSDYGGSSFGANYDGISYDGTNYGVSNYDGVNYDGTNYDGHDGTNYDATKYDGTTLTSPNSSLNDQDNQSIETGSGWLRQQTYPGINQTSYPGMGLDSAVNFRGSSVPLTNEGQLYNSGAPSPSAPQLTLPNMPHISQTLPQTVAQTLPQSIPQSMSQPYLGEFQDQPAFSNEIHQPTPTNTMHHYAQNIRQNFPYNEPMYQSSPAPEQAYLSTQMQPSGASVLSNSLWNNSSQSSFLENRRPFQDYSLSSQVSADSLHASAPQQSNLGNDGGLLNSILLPSASHYSTTNNIWSDRYMSSNYGHNRTVSTGSQLWSNDVNRRAKSPNNAFVSEFLPFSSNRLPSQNGQSDNQDKADYDIRSL